MKETRYNPEPNQPFGLHDCHINEIDASDGNVILSVKDAFYTIGGPNVRGNIVIESIDPDCCDVVILGIGLLVALLGIAFNEQTILIMLGLSLMFLSIIHHVVFYRCPHCGKFLDRSTGEFCPSCGKKVNELE
ncbi:MAG: hypothetical protein MSH15_14255 [Oscillospiraceae bacterium]|nr:hypothetical protein [Oscillospiraceae bacterium]